MWLEFKTMAAEEGIVEAIEAKNRDFVLGVQWHPEDLINKEPSFLEGFKLMVKYAKKTNNEP